MNKKQFIEAVEQDDHFEIKHELISLFFYLDGNKVEINEAIKYAIENSNFYFDKHKPNELDKSTDINERFFAQLSTNLNENFSKERLELMFNIYEKVYKNKPNSRIDDLYPSSKAFPFKKVAIGTGIIIGIFILYKILS